MKSAGVAPAPRAASTEDTVYRWAGRRVHRSSSRLPGPSGSKNLSSSSITASSAAAALLSSSTLGLSCPLGRSHGLSDRRVPGPLAAIGSSRPTTPISSRMTPTMCKFRPGTAFAVTANHKIAPTAIRKRAVPVLSARRRGVGPGTGPARRAERAHRFARAMRPMNDSSSGNESGVPGRRSWRLVAVGRGTGRGRSASFVIRPTGAAGAGKAGAPRRSIWPGNRRGNGVRSSILSAYAPPDPAMTGSRSRE